MLLRNIDKTIIFPLKQV